MNGGHGPRATYLQPMFSFLLLVAPLLVWSGGCTPEVVRSAPPAAPTSAFQMAEDVERLDALVAAGRMSRRTLEAGRDRYAELLEQLRSRPVRDQALQQLAIARAEATLDLYQDLLEIADREASTRAERSEAAEASYARIRRYLEHLLEIEREIDMTPVLLEGGTPSAEAPAPVVEKPLPPPSAQRLLDTYQRGGYRQIIEEVEDYESDQLETLDSGVLVAYALALGATGRIADAVRVMDTVESRALVEPLMLEVRYRHALWLLKEGRREDAARAVDELEQAIQETRSRLVTLAEPTKAVRDDIAHGSSSYLQQSVDVRLAVVDGRFSEARNLCTEMLAREVSRDTIDRVERLLAFVNAAEQQALEAALAEVARVRRTEGRAAAMKRLEEVTRRFESARYRARLESAAVELGTSLAALSGEPGGSEKPSVELPEAGNASGTGRAEAESEAESMEPMAPGGVEETTTRSGVPESGAAKHDAFEATATPTPAPSASDEGPQLAALQQTLEHGKELSTSGKYQEAIQVYESLAGTPLEEEALALRQKAVDRYIQQVRERVAREYVRSSQIRDSAERLELLGGIYDDLREAIESYPETTLKAKAEHNLKVIAGEIQKIDPSYFEGREAGAP